MRAIAHATALLTYVGSQAPQAVPQDSGVANAPQWDDATIGKYEDFEDFPTLSQLEAVGAVVRDHDGTLGPFFSDARGAANSTEQRTAEPDADEVAAEHLWPEDHLVGNLRRKRQLAVMAGRVRDRWPAVEDEVLQEEPIAEGIDKFGVAFKRYAKRGTVLSTDWPDAVLHSSEAQRRLVSSGEVPPTYSPVLAADAANGSQSATARSVVVPAAEHKATRRLQAPAACGDNGQTYYDFGTTITNSLSSEAATCLDPGGTFPRWCAVPGPVIRFYINNGCCISWITHMQYYSNMQGWRWGETTRCVDIAAPYVGNSWTSCPAGFFFTGFRMKSGASSNRMTDIDQWRCCKKISWKMEHRDCTETGHFWNSGMSRWKNCPDQKAIAAMYQEARSDVFGLAKAKCCAIPCAVPAAVMSGKSSDTLRALHWQPTAITDTSPDADANYWDSHRLRKNECLVSGNAVYKACLTWTGQFCIYRASDNAETFCSPALGAHAREVIQRKNGAVEIINAAPEPLWSTFTDGVICNDNVQVILPTNGNMHGRCTYNNGASQLWRTWWSRSPTSHGDGSGMDGGKYRDTLWADEYLYPKDFLISRNRRWMVYHQKNGHLCIFKKETTDDLLPDAPVTGRNFHTWKLSKCHRTDTSPAAYLFLQSDCNLVARNSAGAALWNSATYANNLGVAQGSISSCSAWISDGGDFYVRNVWGMPFWSLRSGLWAPNAATTAVPPGSDALTFLGQNPPQLLGLCEGDCDFDSHCAEGLRCWQRGEAGMGPSVPWCTGVPNHVYDYCVPVQAGMEVPEVSQNPPSRALRLCEANCRNDADCEPGLRCAQRDGADRDVLCGNAHLIDTTGENYCVPRDDSSLRWDWLGLRDAWRERTTLYRGNMLLSPDAKVRLLHREDGNLCAYVHKLGQPELLQERKIWCAYDVAPETDGYYEFTVQGTLNYYEWSASALGGVELKWTRLSTELGGTMHLRHAEW